MSKDVIKLNALELTGPRSFFTDLDPRDPTYDKQAVGLKMKVQLLTKEKILIAASSLFTDIGYDLLAWDQGFVSALEQGIIVPAIRDEFANPTEFFARYKYKDCSTPARNFFVRNATHSVPWNLNENSSLFKQMFYSHLRDANSLLREKTLMTNSMAADFLALLDTEIEKDQSEQRYLRREHIYAVGKQFGQTVCSYVSNYANLLYRIAGSRVVNSESHLPQSNLTKLGVTPEDKIISDESIFWDIYVETVISFLNSAIRLTPERLEKLSVSNILDIRKTLLDTRFSKEYDTLIQMAKSAIDIHDPDKIILKQSEINNAARALKREFAVRIGNELLLKDTASRENSLWQLGNVLSLISTPALGIVVGVLSALQSVPEITALVSKSLSVSLQQRYEWFRNFINSKVGWSKEQRKVLLDGYKELVSYGLPD